ncbi:hypothetical protein EZS27_014282 [termite gut metagenome]|uniref:Uncharacterized protein n=1 Tax=termite gut metagenome TaxID=433724 RepID=A0A5J4RX94_9ZZZZ
MNLHSTKENKKGKYSLTLPVVHLEKRKKKFFIINKMIIFNCLTND